MNKIIKRIDRYLWNRKKRNLPLIIRDWPQKYQIKGATRLYQRKTGRTLNYRNLQLYSEKLQWYKLFYSHPDLSRIVDKYRFKEYIAEKLGAGYTVPLIGAWKRVEDIPWDTLPQVFVLKSNCQSDGKFIKFIKNKDSIDFSALKEELKEWLRPEKTLVNSFCRAYWDVTPMILAEEYIEQIDGDVYDYKFFCFSGKAVCFRIDFNRAVEHKANWYGMDKKPLEWEAGTFACDPNFKPELPDKIDEMIRIAEKLSKGFPFLRVDFYYIDGKIMLSELTFYPGGGFSKYPLDVDREWGELFVLPKDRWSV